MEPHFGVLVLRGTWLLGEFWKSDWDLVLRVPVCAAFDLRERVS